MNQIFNSITNYIHLNASFSDKIGIFDGKGAAVLYFSCIKDIYYKNEISISFLEEILTQINSQTPTTYGNGLAGIGWLLTYLNSKKIICENLDEILLDVNDKIWREVKHWEGTQYNIYGGLSGIMNYLLVRRESRKKLARVDMTKMLSNLESYCMKKKDNIKEADLTILHGIPGMYLIIKKISDLHKKPIEL